MTCNNSWIKAASIITLVLLGATGAFAGEADIKIPPLDAVRFGGLSGMTILYA
jgi:hypothetical protein